MATFLLIVLLFVVVFGYIMPRILPHLLKWYLKRKVRNHMQNMGYGDPFKESKKSRTQNQQPKKHHGKIIPTEYGVDVEYTEIHSESEQVEVNSTPQGETKVTIEEQVSDAEWVEIKRNV